MVPGGYVLNTAGVGVDDVGGAKVAGGAVGTDVGDVVGTGTGAAVGTGTGAVVGTRVDGTVSDCVGANAGRNTLYCTFVGVEGPEGATGIAPPRAVSPRVIIARFPFGVSVCTCSSTQPLPTQLDL